MTDMIESDLDALAARISDGAKLVVFKAEGGAVAMAATRALVRRGVRGLHLVTAPTSGLQADLLIGAGCVATVETSGISLGELGQAPRFGAAVRAGAVRILDSTCPAVYAGLQAGQKGVPFIPLRGLIGSDIVAFRDDYRVISNPYEQDDPIVAIPAIVPDYALFHVPMADRAGNVWLGRQTELKVLAHAARHSLVTCERLYEGSLLEDERLAPATLSSLYVDAVAVAPRGAWPYAMTGEYPTDEDHLGEYARLAATEEGFAAYVGRHVHSEAAAAAE